MIVSMNTIAKLPRWLSGGVLALAMGLLPFGIAYGQDYDAVEQRLGAAVADGEITLSQAQTMMRALRATSQDRELEKLKAGIEERLRHHGEELRKQLAAGEITKEEMEEKYKAAEREMWGHYREAEMKHQHAGTGKAEDQDLKNLKAGIEQRLRRLGEGLRRQVAADKITQKELKEKYKAAEREMWGHYREAEMQRHRGEHERGKGDDHDTSHEPFMQRIREIEEAMKAGKLSREEGERALIESRRAMEGALDKGDDSQAELGRKMQEVVKVVEAYEAKLMKEVEAGRISKDEFSKKLVAYSNTVMSRILGSGNNRSRKADPRSERYSEIKTRLDQAVDEEDASEEDEG